MRIRYVKIDGLYSYGSEKNEIRFDKKTVVVGANDSGKSSIFKALNFFLQCLTGYDHDRLDPWRRQGIHEMTVGLSLNDEERRYTAEILSVDNPHDGVYTSHLAPDKVIEWLAPGLERVELTISWRDRLFQISPDARLYLRLVHLGVTVCSNGFNGDAWVIESSKSLQRESGDAWFYNIIADMPEEDPTAEDLGAKLVHGAKIPKFPEAVRLDDEEAATRHRSRIGLVARASGSKTQSGRRYFFTIFGRMLERGFTFVSEQRNFHGSNGLERPAPEGMDQSAMSPLREPNGLERPPLKSDGSNLQSYMFWLQNGRKDEQDALSAIRSMFEEVLEQQNLSFVVSAAERKLDKGTGPQAVYPGNAFVQFVNTLDREQRPLDFMSVGAGVRETLFLLAMCFGMQDGAVLLDEPAANLHPTQIRRLMDKIMSAGDQGARAGQIALITHSPSLASLDMLSSVNEIVRVNRREHSLVAQPSGEDKEWIKENLPTFHHLKSDIFFARRVVLVEGVSDKFFLEAILNRGSGRGDDAVVVDVGGKK